MPPATATIWHSSTDKSVFVGCGLQHHRLRDSSPAHWYRPPSRPVYPAVACEPTLAPLRCGPGAPARALIWATTHRGESLHGSPGIQWRIPEHIGGKKPKHLDSLEKVRGTVCTHDVQSLGQHSSVPRETFLPVISTTGESGRTWVSTSFPSSSGRCQRSPVLSCPIQKTGSWAAWLGGGKKLGDGLLHIDLCVCIYVLN